jgi:hypothetical protein
MAEKRRRFVGWLQDGAHFYVCSDATRMARPVPWEPGVNLNVGWYCTNRPKV